MGKLPGRESHKPARRSPNTVLIDWFLADFLNDRDRGACVMGCRTIIRRSERCAMAVDEADLSKTIGYICGPCTDDVLEASGGQLTAPADVGEPPW